MSDPTPRVEIDDVYYDGVPLRVKLAAYDPAVIQAVLDEHAHKPLRAQIKEVFNALRLYWRDTVEITVKDRSRPQPVFNLVDFLSRQRDWSRRTFGPNDGSGPVDVHSLCDHLRKEVEEVGQAPYDLNEWIDIAILAFDGAWRCALESDEQRALIPGAATGKASPETIARALFAKLAENARREWPNWREQKRDGKAIEHIRSAESTPGPNARDIAYAQLERELLAQIDARVPGVPFLSGFAAQADQALRPSHYGGADDPYEAIKVIQAWGLGFELGNVIKYVRRVDTRGTPMADLQKAAQYLQFEIARRRQSQLIGGAPGGPDAGALQRLRDDRTNTKRDTGNG